MWGLLSSRIGRFAAQVLGRMHPCLASPPKRSQSHDARRSAFSGNPSPRGRASLPSQLTECIVSRSRNSLRLPWPPLSCGHRHPRRFSMRSSPRCLCLAESAISLRCLHLLAMPASPKVATHGLCAVPPSTHTHNPSGQPRSCSLHFAVRASRGLQSLRHKRFVRRGRIPSACLQCFADRTCLQSRHCHIGQLRRLARVLFAPVSAVDVSVMCRHAPRCVQACWRGAGMLRGVLRGSSG